jgi:hypothetical protein
MDDKERRYRGLGFVLGLLGIVLGAWLWHRAASSAQSPARVQVARVAAKHGGVKPDELRPAVGPAPAGPATPEKASLEFCGYGKFPVDAADPGAGLTQLRKLTDAARKKWRSTLLDSDDLRARAAGLLLDGMPKTSDGGPPVPATASLALVQLAVGSSDPAVYALAVADCRSHPDPDGACAPINATGWADRDPDNALPWLMLAEQAHKAGDRDAEARAMTRAANATRVENYTDSLYAFAVTALPSDVTPLERWTFAIETNDLGAAMPAPVSLGFQDYCTADAMHDPQAHARCDALAELYVSRATTIRDFSVGIVLGQRAGWPASRLGALRREQKALMVGMIDLFSEMRTPWSCAAVRAGNALVSEQLQNGELATARADLERSGESIDTRADRYDARMERLVHDAQQRQPPAGRAQ